MYIDICTNSTHLHYLSSDPRNLCKRHDAWLCAACHGGGEHIIIVQELHVHDKTSTPNHCGGN